MTALDMLIDQHILPVQESILNEYIEHKYNTMHMSTFELHLVSNYYHHTKHDNELDDLFPTSTSTSISHSYSFR